MKWASGWTGIARSLIFFKKFSFGRVLAGLWITLCKTFDPINCKSLIYGVTHQKIAENGTKYKKIYVYESMHCSVSVRFIRRYGSANTYFLIEPHNAIQDCGYVLLLAGKAHLIHQNRPLENA